MRKPAILAALGLLVCVPALAQQRSTVLSPPLDGTWKATVADSVASGTVYWTFEVQADSSVSGSYYNGTITGRLDGETFYFTITQTAEGCPGSYSGSLVLQNDRGTGSYTGSDCEGEHEKGVVSMVRATEEEIAGIQSPDIASSVFGQQAPDWAADPDPTPSRIRLIVRGDDFGNTHASNRALEQAFATGLMTSASIMPAAPWFVETAALIRSHPNWVIGLHLSITSGWDRLRYGPTLSPDEVPSLVAPDGYFFHSYPPGLPLSLEILRKPPYLFGDDEEMPAPTLVRRRRLTSSDVPAPDEVEAELRSQIRRARQLGVRIDYLDCHMGAACSPPLRSVLIRLAEELCVPIPERGWMGHTDIHFRIGGDADMATRNFADRLRSLRPGLYRVVLHPVVDSSEARAVDSFFGLKSAHAGQAELEALASDEIQAVVAEKSIELVSVRDLWDYEECHLKSAGAVPADNSVRPYRSLVPRAGVDPASKVDHPRAGVDKLAPVMKRCLPTL